MWFTRHGAVCKRLMTDNAFSYTKNTSLAALLTDNQIRHLTTKPYRKPTARSNDSTKPWPANGDTA